MSRSELKAIETVYNGFRFRSRLEARWAVFFDTLGVKYDYEVEGYEFVGGEGHETLRYLPDFFVPAWDAFIEIKALPLTGEEMRKCQELLVASRKHVLAVSGSPWPGQYAITKFELMVPHPGNPKIKPGLFYEDAFTAFAQCRRCEGLSLLVDEEGQFGWTDIGEHTCGDHDRAPLIGERILAACTAARQARFEHGESPRRSSVIRPVIELDLPPGYGDDRPLPIWRNPEFRRGWE